MKSTRECLIDCGDIKSAIDAFAAVFSASDCERADELSALFVRAQADNEDGARAFYDYAEKYDSAAGYAFSYLYKRGVKFVYRAGEYVPIVREITEEDNCYKRVCAILSDEAIVARGLMDRAEQVLQREKELSQMSAEERFEAERAASKDILHRERKLMRARLLRRFALNLGRLIAIGGMFAIVIVGILVVTDVI